MSYELEDERTDCPEIPCLSLDRPLRLQLGLDYIERARRDASYQSTASSSCKFPFQSPIKTSLARWKKY